MVDLKFYSISLTKKKEMNHANQKAARTKQAGPTELKYMYRIIS